MPGVYISYPFCAQKCTYCNFASGVFPADREHAYLDALLREIASTEWPWLPETVYLGGGTPSRMAPEHLSALLDAVPGRPWREATIEAAPGAWPEDAPSHWRRAGINRVSLGVQSFAGAELRRTGRRHDAAAVEHNVNSLRAAGIANFNIDLIAGLPGQSRESWRHSLEATARLDAPHVSLYMLEIDEDSRLGKEVLFNGQRYGAPDVPSDEAIVEFYESGLEFLRAAGLDRYEISNFARPGFESRHNLKYWRLEPYLGFGADAHSFDGALRWRNEEDPGVYTARIAGQGNARGEPVAANRIEERFFVGLRLSSGIRPEPEERALFREPIERFLAEGFLEQDGGLLRLTRRGVIYSNEVFQEFLIG